MKLSSQFLLVALMLVGCTRLPTGDLSGTVRLSFASPTEVAEAMHGEIIVGFKAPVLLQGLPLKLSGISLKPLRTLNAHSTIYRVEGSLPQAIAILHQQPFIAYAHPNYILRKSKIPSDPLYPQQWNLPTLNLPQLWESQNGTSVVVGIVDTGILFMAGNPNQSHPDLADKVLPGYDFIIDPKAAGDGGGRDPDPYDDGNMGSKEDRSDYHGSHVAGIVAAASDNQIGIAGVSWGARILPIRVLGSGGGALSDIIEGILWAAGIEVLGVPTNPNPAQIINLSLGGEFRCSTAPALQEALDQVRAKGVIVVAAAGNQGINAAFFSPAGCTGVIAVGATNQEGNRPTYSNFGPRIDVMAPGGDVGSGILSLFKDDATNQMTYTRQAGTSMAAPQVAGVLALLKSQKPDLNFEQALDVLKRSARLLSATACTNGASIALNPSDCGAGLVDAYTAYQILSGNTPPGPPPPNPAPPPDPGSFTFYPDPSSLVLQAGQSATLSIQILTTGGFSQPITLKLQALPPGFGATLSQPSNNRSTLDLAIADTAVPSTYTLAIEAMGGGLERTAGLTVVVQPPNTPTPKATLKGTVLSACFWDAKLGGCDPNRSKVVEIKDESAQAPFNFTNLLVGDYYLFGWKDVDQDGKLSDPDYSGAYTLGGEQVPVRPSLSNLTLKLDLLSNVAAQGSAITAAIMKLMER